MRLIRLLLLTLSGTLLHAEEVEWKSPTGTLKGTLEPVEGQKESIVLILPGSGPTDRDGNSQGLPGKNHSLKLLAQGLKERGIPSLRIDKRGIGESRDAGPKEENLRFETYIEDAIGWVQYLKSEKGYRHVSLIGHSEGALIALCAANRTEITSCISLAGVGRRASVVLRDQLNQRLPKELKTEAMVVLQQLDQGTEVKKVSPGLEAVFRRSVQPYLISWFKVVPTEEAGKLTCPLLIVQGTTDIQITVADSEALHSAKPTSRLVKIEGMNHILKKVGPDPTEQIASYSTPELPLHPELLPAITGFLKNPAP